MRAQNNVTYTGFTPALVYYKWFKKVVNLFVSIEALKFRPRVYTSKLVYNLYLTKIKPQLLLDTLIHPNTGPPMPPYNRQGHMTKCEGLDHTRQSHAHSIIINYHILSSLEYLRY